MGLFKRIKKRKQSQKANTNRKVPYMMEMLEPRIMLSADFEPLAAASMADGLNQLGDRIEVLLDGEDLFDTRTPFIVQVEREGEGVRNVAPTLGTLFSVPVDHDGIDGIDTTPGSTESELDALDIDGDGMVDGREFIQGWFFDKIQYDQQYDPSFPTNTTAFADYLKNDLDHWGTEALIIDVAWANPITIEFDVFATDNTEAAIPIAELAFDVDFVLKVSQDLAIDLGTEADALKVLYYTGSYENKVSPVIPVDTTMEFGFTFGLRTGGQESPGETLNEYDFFVRTADDLYISAESTGNTGVGFNLNIGFLGAQVSGGSIDFQAAVSTLLIDPDSPEILGFTTNQYGVEQPSGVVAGSVAIPSEDLAHDAGFVLRIGNAGIATTVTVLADDTNNSLADVVDDVNDALPAGLGDLVEASLTGANQIRFTLLPTDAIPLGFANEAYAVDLDDASDDGSTTLTAAGLPVGGGATVFEFTSDVSFLLSLDGALPYLITIPATDPAIEDIGFAPADSATLSRVAADNSVPHPTAAANFSIFITDGSGSTTSAGISVGADVLRTTVAGLVSAINLQLGISSLSDDVRAVVDPDDATKIAFEAKLPGGSDVTSIKVLNAEEIGFASSQISVLSLTAADAASLPLTDDAHFDLIVDSTRYSITVTPADVAAASGATDLEKLVDAINTKLPGAISGKIVAVEDGSKVILQLDESSPDLFIDSFEVKVPKVTKGNTSLADLVENLDRVLDDMGLSITAGNDGGNLTLTAAVESLEITKTLTLDAGVTYQELVYTPTEDLFFPDIDEANSNITFDLPVSVLQTPADINYNPTGAYSPAIVGDFNPFGRLLDDPGLGEDAVAQIGPQDVRFDLNFTYDPDLPVPDQDSPASQTWANPEEIRLVNMAEPLNFNLVTAESMVGLIMGMGTALQEIANSGLFATYDIPFADASLSEVLNFSNPDTYVFSGLIDTLLIYDTGGNGIDEPGVVDPAPNDTNKLLKRIIDDKTGDGETEDDDVYLLPNFVTAQELAKKLDDILVDMDLAGINANYDTSTNELTYDVELIGGERTSIGILDTNPDTVEFDPYTVPFEYDVDLSPFAKLTLDTAGPDEAQELILQGYTGLRMTFGIDLSPPGYIIDGSTNLVNLNGGDGVDIKTERAITGAGGVRTLYALSRNATFEIKIDGGSPILVEIDAEATQSNENLGALIFDINNALTEALLGTGYEGQVIAGLDADNPSRLKLYASGGASNIQLIASLDDPTVLELGFAGDQAAASSVTALRAPTIYVGRLTEDASFLIDIAGDGNDPYLVTIEATQTNPDTDMPFSTGNRTIADLVADVNNALAAAGLSTDPDVAGGIRADYDNSSDNGTRLVLTATDDTTEFNVTPSLDAPSIFELGLPYNGGLGANANQYDFIVYDRSGTPHEIALDGVGPTVQDLINVINSQTGGDIEAGLNPTHTGLQLLDTSGSTLHDRPWVRTVNGSGALLTLGLFSADNSGDELDLDEGVLVGGPIGLTHLDDRFFVRDAELWGAVGLQTHESSLAHPPGGIPASALFGIVGVDTNLQGEMYAEFTAEIKDPDTGVAGGTATLLELFEGGKQGRLSSDAIFTLDIADDGEIPYTITVPKSETLDGEDRNFTLEDLVVDINEALETAGIDTEHQLEAQVSGTRIVFVGKSADGPEFTINAGGTAVSELGLPDLDTTSTPDENGIQTLTATKAASRYAVTEAVITEAYELAFGDYIAGNFKPGSMVYGWADTDDDNFPDTLTGGAALVLDAEPGVLTLAHVEGTFAGAGWLLNTADLWTATIGAYGTGGEAVQKDSFGDFTLYVDVQDGFDDLGFVVGDSTHGFGLLDGQHYEVEFALTGFGNPYEPEPPAVTFADLENDTGDLYYFRELDYADINLAFLGALDPEIQGLLGILQDVEANLIFEDTDPDFKLLTDPLPAIGKSISDLLNLVDGFEKGTSNLDEILAAAMLALEPGVDLPALTLQDIPNALRGAFGLPEGVDPDGVDPDDGSPNVDWVKLDFDKDNHMLLMDLSLNENISTKLGLDIEVGEGLPHMTSGGVLKAEGNLDLNLSFGIDLDAPNDAYLFDTSSITVGLEVKGEAQEYGEDRDGLGMVFWASLGSLAVFVQDADALIDIAFVLPGLDFGGDVKKLIRDVVYDDWNDPIISEDEVDIVLPMFYGGEGPNDYLDDFAASGSLSGGLTVTVPDYQPILDDITDGTIAYDPFENILLAIDTLNLYLEGLSDILADEVLGNTMPFIGDQMADILFIESFRSTLYNTLKNEIENDIDPTPADVTSLLGTALAGYLDGEIAYSSEMSGDVLDWFHQWNFALSGEKTVTLSDFDLGIPNLNFDLDVPVTVDIDWELDLGFGVNFVEGAYIDVSNIADHELDIDLTISMPESGTGMFGFLLVDVTGGGDSGVILNFDVDVQKGETTDDHLGFSDLGSINPRTTVTGTPLGNASDGDGDGDPDVFTLHLATEAKWGLPHLEADLIIDWALPNNTLVFSLGVGNVLEGNLVTPPGGPGIRGVDYIALSDMKFDSGSVARSLLEPLFGTVLQYIEPFMPVVDVLTAPIPILSDLAGEPFTLLDLAGIFGEVNPEFIDAIADILDVMSIINDAMATNWIPLGHLVLFDAAEGIENFDPYDADSELFEIDLNLLDQEEDPDVDGLWVPRGGEGDADTFDYIPSGNKFLKLVRHQEVEGLSMPIFTDPLQAIGLFLNQNATMVDYKLPPLGVEFEYLQVFPVWGPLAVSIEISFGFTVDLHSVGFDTYGFQRYADGGFRNPAVMFDGFYLNDLNEEGVDEPEVSFGFGLVGAAELNLGIARAGVGGGIRATIFFDWLDPIADGHVHLSELWANMEYADPGPNPLAVFDLGGALTFQLFAFLEISIIGFEQEFPITPETELFSFDVSFDHDPVLATKIIDEDTGDGILILNMGQNSADRIYGNTSDGHEGIELSATDSDSVEVTSSTFGVTNPQTFDGIKHIVAIGGQGNDSITLDLTNSSTITYELEGGLGDDHIEVTGGGGGTIHGGIGNDTLKGGGGNDIIWGEEGNDIIDGRGGYDILFGDQGRYFALESDPDPLVTSRIKGSDGDDIISGGTEDDIIIGAGGDDTLGGDAGNDVIIGDGGRFAYLNVGDHFELSAVLPDSYNNYTPPGINDYVPPDEISDDIDEIHDDVLEVFHATDLGFGGNDNISGGEGGDLIFGGTADDIIDGDADDDLIFGGKGFDDISGGANDDTIFGEDQADTISGNGGNDVISGGTGNDYIHGNEHHDVMKGDSGADVMFGDAGDDLVLGQTEPDVLMGGVDNDLVIGGTGSDIMFGDDGVVAKLDPSDGTGSKVVYNTLDFSETTIDNLLSNALSEEGNYYDDDIRTVDLIQTYVVANDGNDILSGNAGDDLMFGGGGNDTMGGDVDPRLETFDRPTEISEDVMIGDGGRITFDQRRYRSIATIIGDTTGSPFDDTIYGDNGNDYILGGRGNDTLAGGHGPDRGATDATASDNDVIIGDNGELLFADDSIEGNFGRLELIRTTDEIETTGGADTAYGEEGADVILGGVNNSGIDKLYGDYYDYTNPEDTPAIIVGNDVILGDNGELNFAFDQDTPSPGDDDTNLDTLDLIRSYRDGLGGEDWISGSQGYDVLIGGTGGDFMYGDDEFATNGALDGEDIMMGDNGDIFLINDPAFVPDGENDDLEIAAYGRLLVRVTDMAYGTTVDLITTTDAIDADHLTKAEAEACGGPDTMSGNAKADIMLGGVNNDDGILLNGIEKDIMYGDRGGTSEADQPTSLSIFNDGDDIMLGDNGLLDFTYDPNDYSDIDPPITADSDRNTLDLIRSFEDALGGVDVISGNKGLDVAIGGTAGDTIYGDDENASAAANDLGDLLLGDNADIFLVAKGTATGGDLKLVLPEGEETDAAVKTIRTTDEEYDPNVAEKNTGGRDTISGNATGDIIAGGVEGDTIYGDRASEETTQALDGNDIILGDNGAFEWLSAGRLVEVEGIDIAANNADLYDWFTTLYPGGDEDLTTLDLVTTEQPNNGGRDTIYGDEFKDMVFGGTDADTIYGDDGMDLPEGSGTISNDDLLFGDHGRLYPQLSVLRTPGQPWGDYFHSRNFFAIDVADGDGGEGDRMWGEEGDDTMVGQQGDDRMWGGSGDDDMTGGHNVAGGYDELSYPAIIATLNPLVNDLMDGGSGNDSMAGDNAIIWRRGDDVSPRFHLLTEASMYTTGPDGVDTIITNVGTIWQSDPDDAVGRDIQLVDHSDAVEATPLGRFGDDVMAGGADSDVMFGELGNDLMQGDGAIETSEGDPSYLSYELDVDDTGYVAPDPDTSEILYFNIPETETDADDYMEGNGGSDLMFGGLGQDDIIGGSSALFGLDDPDPAIAETLRPDDSDIIFGGAGNPERIERNDFVGLTDTDEGTDEDTGAMPTDDDPMIALEDRHSRDADFIMGDNANVYRLVNNTDEFLEFNYDQDSSFENRGEERIIPHAMEQLDYTLGGADYAGGSYTNWGAANDDNGKADLIHGESGDDYIFGMTGSDVMFGESDDDDIIGGYGNDWISGGTGQDGVLGDDGLLFTSRNSTLGEPLYGIEGLLASDPSTKYNNGTALDEIISTPGDIQYAVINVAGELKKTADLVPFSLDPEWLGMDDEFPDDASNTPFADDIIFGGLDSDWLHGGSGDDAMSGAEALEHAYVPIFDSNGDPDDVLDLGYNAFDLLAPIYPGDTVANPNPGNVLAFNPVDLDGQHLNNRFRAGEFFLYDEYDPLRIILLTPTGELYKDDPAAGIEGWDYFQFLLNFDQAEGVFRPDGWTPGNQNQTEYYPAVSDDGKDAIFGDLGNDWLVGGSGRDNIYGGWGNDLINADDDQTTPGDEPKHGGALTEGANDVPDTHPFYEDRAYGGAGRDILIANTGGDRLIDWVGEYNSYLVPYAPFGQASVSRTLMPHLQEFLYALSDGDGADPTRSSDAVGGEEPEPTNNNPIPSRNGEPHGELGLVLQKDFAWQDQTGAPADPQAGNIPGGKRDVLRTASFNLDDTQGWMLESGTWVIMSGRYYVEPAVQGTDAVSLWNHDQVLPSYFELTATINPVKPIAGYKANAYIVFDYYGEDDFKFAGLNSSTNKVEIGQRTADGWQVMTSANMQIKDNRDYNILLAVNGTGVTVLVNNSLSLSYAFAPRVDGYGISHNLKDGMVGLGSDNGKAAIDNVTLQVLPPVITLTRTDDFSDAPALVAGQTGAWTLSGGYYVGTPAVGQTIALAGGDLTVGASYLLQLETKIATGQIGGIIFDQYDVDDFKWAAVDKATGQVMIGHYTERSGWVVSASVTRTLGADDTALSVTLKGSTVSVMVDGQAALSFAFNAVVTDGGFGLLAKDGSVSFDFFTVSTDDPSFAVETETDNLMAAAVPVVQLGENITDADLAPIVAEAIDRWENVLGVDSTLLTALYDMNYQIVDFDGLVLGQAMPGVIIIDEDAAGYGWFIDDTPEDDVEFTVADSEADDKMDLLTVVMHELGHVLGLEDLTSEVDAGDLMYHELSAGVRRTETNMATTINQFEITALLYWRLQDDDDGIFSDSLYQSLRLLD